jgi:hypothetical protein
MAYVLTRVVGGNGEVWGKFKTKNMRNKLLILGLFVLIGIKSQAQIYTYEVLFGSGIFVKTTGSFIITDTTVQTKAITNGKEVIQNFIRKPSSTSAIYYTDGVQTFMLSIQPEVGKKKGYEHEYMIVLSNLNTPNIYYAYYSNLQK